MNCILVIWWSIKTSLRNDRAYVWARWITSCQPIANRLSGLIRIKYVIDSSLFVHKIVPMGAHYSFWVHVGTKTENQFLFFHFLRDVSSLLQLVPGMGCLCWRKECLLLTRWEIWKRKIESLFLASLSCLFYELTTQLGNTP